MLFPIVFRKKWISFNDEPFIVIDDSDIRKLNIPIKHKQFLLKSGLPEWAAPHLYFFKPKFLNDIYVKFGEDMFDNYICVNNITGLIEIIDKDNFSKLAYFNKSIPIMCETLFIYQEIIEKSILIRGNRAFIDNQMPNYLISEFETKLLSIDKDAINAEQSFWKNETHRIRDKNKILP